MIPSPITYGAASRVLISRFEAANEQVGAYWSDTELNATRKEIKQYYIAAQQHQCCYCALPNPSTHGLNWDVEHVVPRQTHAAFMFTGVNLAVACRECNSRKGRKQTLVDSSVTTYPSSPEAFLIVHPHFDNWTDHILRDDVTYASFTSKGKWTIRECDLNRFSGRMIGLRYAISDDRYENTVRRLLKEDMTLQEIVDKFPMLA